MKVLELYSGIGGMHWALKASGFEAEIRAAVDINPIANRIYSHNFPDVTLLNRNIQSLTPNQINSTLDVDTILMSPPCQPFTRNGLQKDTNDDRTDSFKYLLSILPQLKVDKILLENVKGFEVSQIHDLFIETLTKCGFHFDEFLLSPGQFGVPNSRTRYYCVARKSCEKQESTGKILEVLPEHHHKTDCWRVSSITEENPAECYLLSDKILCKYIKLLDIAYMGSTNTCCFTKAYGRFIEGTGSVLCTKDKKFTETVFKKIEACEMGSEDYLDLVRSLDLRFFTPKEVSRLMCFPECFSFPEGITDRQKYAVLGNSLNVKVVSELIKFMNR